MAPYRQRTSNSLILRKQGAFADISIYGTHITRNEILHTMKVLEDGTTTPIINDIFNNSAYDIVDHLKNMDDDERAVLFEKKHFEIVVQDPSINPDGPPISLSNFTTLETSSSSPVNLTQEEFCSTAAGALLQDIAKTANTLRSLKIFDVVVNLPDGTDIYQYQHIIYPFYDLHIKPVKWGIKTQYGNQDRRYVSRASLNGYSEDKALAMATKSEEFRKPNIKPDEMRWMLEMLDDIRDR